MKPSPAAEPLIPGLPDDVAEQCLLHLPFPHHSLARSVSSSWNHALTSPAFVRLKSTAPPPLHPTLFVLAYHRPSLRLHFHSLDPASRRWFRLPPVPLPLTPTSLAASAVNTDLHVLGGGATSVYQPATNSWSAVDPMQLPTPPFSAGAVCGSVVVAGGEDAAVVGGRMYVTEGWTWPFTCLPRGAVYESGRWGEMREGMREGWTGRSAVAAGRVVVVAEYGDRRVKVYEEGRDRWLAVAGGGVPAGVRRPFAVSGTEDGRVFVVGSGLDVAVGRLAEGGGEGWSVEWEVVKGPPAVAELAPCSAHVLYV